MIQPKYLKYILTTKYNNNTYFLSCTVPCNCTSLFYPEDVNLTKHVEQ